MSKGIILMNLGSPDSTEVKDVRRYLNEFLMDEKVIDIPYLARLLLVRGIISPFRAPKSAKAYRSVWTDEGSPLVVLTKQLQAALQPSVEPPVTIAMRYGNPSPQAAFDELLAKVPDLEEVVAVPLYPHYAMSSYETAVEYAQKVHEQNNYPFKLTFIEPFYKDSDYINALCASIEPYLKQDYDQILFSYHGLPERHLRKSDTTGSHCLKVDSCCSVDSPAHATCYRHQCIMTTQLVAAQLNIPKDKFKFAFQSRLGRDEWLKPYTVVRLAELPKEGVKKLLVVCPAFVSDCLETLEEMAEEGQEVFLEAGGASFTFIPCMNIQPLWVETLGKWVKAAFAEKLEVTPSV